MTPEQQKYQEPKPVGLTVEDYRDALKIQDACNLCGIAQTFAKVMIKIIEESRKNPETDNSDWRNEHPIAVLYTNVIMKLTTGREMDYQIFEPSYNICKELRKC